MAHSVLIPELSDSLRQGEIISVTGDEAHHAIRTKRVALDEAVTVMNGKGLVAHSIVQKASAREGRLDLLINSFEIVQRLQPRITIASAVPKGRRTDSMIDALSQAGADAWIPMVCDRSVVSRRENESKSVRWERIARESTKQCRRAWLMEIEPIQPLCNLVQQYASSGARLIIGSGEGSHPSHVLGGESHNGANHNGMQHVVICVGPEGGFTDEEIQFMRDYGGQPMNLGPHILRIETAAVCATAIARAMRNAVE